MKKWILGVALAAAAVAAQAQVYGTVAGGLTYADDDCDGVSSCDKTAAGFRGLVGYQFNRNLAIEAGYFNFGKISATGQSSGVNVSIDMKTAGFGVGVAVMEDFAPQLRGVARLGLASLTTKASGSFSYLGVPYTYSDDDSNVALIGGVAIGYKLNQNLSIDASVDFGKHKYQDGSSNAMLFGLGLTASF